MEKTRKWRKILAMMLTVVMMLQNAQSVMVFADVTNEQIEQRLAGNQGQTEETQPAQSQVDTRANGEEYKTQSQETQENGNGSTDTPIPIKTIRFTFRRNNIICCTISDDVRLRTKPFRQSPLFP